MKPESRRLILALSYLTYLLFGAFTAAMGPVLAELASQTSATLAAIGGVLTFLFLGAILAQIAAGPITDRLGHKTVLVASLIVLGLGIFSFTSAHALPLMFALIFLAGLGQGGVDMGANLVVADAAPGNTTSALNLLHFFFGLGAFIGPALVGLSIAIIGSGLPVHWIVAALFVALGIAMALLLPVHRQAVPQEVRSPSNASSTLSVYLSPILWLMGVLMLIYVGVEIALGSWISAYMGITTGMLPQYGAWVTSSYWASLAVGRLAGALASRRLSRLQLLAASLTGSLIGGLGLFAARGHILSTVLCLAWIAFSYGTVYPTTVALGTTLFVDGRGKAISILVAMGSLGAAVFPLIAGALLEGKTGAAFPVMVSIGLACLVLLLLLIAQLLRRGPRERAVSRGAAS